MSQTTNTPVTRRTLVRGAAWATPAVVAAAAAPLVSASPVPCTTVTKLVYADAGVTSPSGQVPTGMLTYSYGYGTSTPNGIGRLTQDPATGLQWMVTDLVEKITNTSTSTISNLVQPLPFMAVAYPRTSTYYPMLWLNAVGCWESTAMNVGSYTNDSEPHAGYVVTLRDSAGALIPVEPMSTYDPYLAPSFRWSATASSTITATDSIPVIYPSSTILAPGESATFTYSVWREYRAQTVGSLAFGFPNLVLGTVEECA